MLESCDRSLNTRITNIIEPSLEMERQFEDKNAEKYKEIMYSKKKKTRINQKPRDYLDKFEEIPPLFQTVIYARDNIKNQVHR